jgi:hypothetical protein
MREHVRVEAREVKRIEVNVERAKRRKVERVDVECVERREVELVELREVEAINAQRGRVCKGAVGAWSVRERGLGERGGEVCACVVLLNEARLSVSCARCSREKAA